MKLNELIGSFNIYTTNEEQQELTQLEGMVPFGSFNEAGTEELSTILFQIFFCEFGCVVEIK